MKTLKSRLIECFLLVFPELSESDIPELSASAYGDWDSLSTVNLVGVLKEEFDFQVTPENAEKCTSFQEILELISSNQNSPEA